MAATGDDEDNILISQVAREKYGVERGLWPEIGSPEHMAALTWVSWMA